MGKELKIADPFAQTDDLTFAEVIAPISGGSPLDTIPRNVVARPVSIFEIERDPLQPRRAIPSAAMLGWDGTTERIPGVLDRWYDLAKAHGLNGTLSEYLEGEAPPILAGSPTVEAYVSLLGIARSILEGGLGNPIRVAGRRIESGERRWLAHHLLLDFTSDKKWTLIPAIEVGQASVWRQASENGARENLNAISRARQLSLLLMDLYADRYGVEFEQYGIPPGECDQPFYAQVADGEDYPVPVGAGSKLVEYMGLRHAVQIRQYRGLLRVAPEIWQQADDESWAETKLRAYVPKRGSEKSGRVTVVTQVLPRLKVTQDLAPKWQMIRETMRKTHPQIDDQNMFTRVVEFWVDAHKGGVKNRA